MYIGGGLVTHGMFVPWTYDMGIFTFGLRAMAFDALSRTSNMGILGICISNACSRVG